MNTCRHCNGPVDGDYPFCSAACHRQHTALTPEMLAEKYRDVRMTRESIRMTMRVEDAEKDRAEEKQPRRPYK